MQSLKNFLDKKNIKRKIVLDDKTVFYLFKQIIKEEFGNMGLEKLIPDYFAQGILHIKSQSSAWSSELELQKSKIIRQINKEIGSEQIRNIKLK